MEIHSFKDTLAFIKKYGNIPQKCKNFEKNFLNYLDLYSDEQKIIVMHEMTRYDYSRQILCSFRYSISKSFKMEAALNVIKDMDFEKGLNYLSELYSMPFFLVERLDQFNFLHCLFKYNKYEYICTNIDIILSYIDIDYFIGCYLPKFDNITPEMLSKIRYAIVSKIALGAINREVYNKAPIKAFDYQTLNALSILFDEISKNENTSFTELRYIDAHGFFSKVYKLGNKVIKIGIPRVTYEIPYHRRLLQPLIRREILKGQLYIEISEYLDSGRRITEEDVYLVFKELRDDGILWFDPTPDNLGRLKKNNIIHFKSPLNIENDSVGFLPSESKNNQVLSKGDLIIIDLDFLFKENDYENINRARKVIELDNFYKYELRYQKEKSKNEKEEK